MRDWQREREGERHTETIGSERERRKKERRLGERGRERNEQTGHERSISDMNSFIHE